MPRTDHSTLAQMTASHCCVCRAELTDAESVEHGIGPTCSDKHYDPLHRPTQKMVQGALGLLAVSELPDHIIDGFLRLVNNDHENARLGSNLLVYWASCHYDNRAEVFKCSAIIRALGYTVLADRLEIDRTAAHVVSTGTEVVAYVGSKDRFEKDMTFVPGAVKDKSSKVGSKTKWTIPLAEKDHFLCVLGVSYGGKLGCGNNPSGRSQRVWTIPPKRWSDLRVFRQPKTAPAPTSSGGTPTFQPGNICLNLAPGNTLEVKTPYNASFVKALKDAVPYRDRKWDGDRRIWHVRASYFTAVTALIGQHYPGELA